MSRTFNLHNNNSEKLLKNCQINNQIIVFQILNEFINFSESISIY